MDEWGAYRERVQPIKTIEWLWATKPKLGLVNLRSKIVNGQGSSLLCVDKSVKLYYLVFSS